MNGSSSLSTFSALLAFSFENDDSFSEILKTRYKSTLTINYGSSFGRKGVSSFLSKRFDQEKPSKNLWFLMSSTPFFKFPKRFDRSLLSKCFTKLLHFLNKISNLIFLRIKPFWVAGLGVNNFSVDIHGVFVLEGWESSQHFVYKNSECPPVNWLSVSLIE